MMRSIRSAGALVVALVLAGPAAAPAGTPPLVEFGESWFYDAAPAPSPYAPFPAQPTIVGFVARFAGPLEPLNDLMPAVQFTFVQFDLASRPPDQTGIPGAPGTVQRVYGGGRLEILADRTPNATFVSPGSFGDGEAVLVARCEQLTFVSISDVRSYTGPTVLSGGLVLIGGSEMTRLAPTAGTFRMQQMARVVTEPTALDPERTVLGYSGRLEGAVELRPETAVAPATWGRIKTLLAD
jgi:hypothetical protein